MTWVALGPGALVGLTLGLVGGGGSLLAVPLLGLLGLDAGAAKAGALLVVAAAAAAGLLAHLRAGSVDLRAALLVGGAGAPASLLTAAATRGLPDGVQTGLFAVVAAVAGALLLRRPSAPAEGPGAAPRPRAGSLQVLGAGAAAGVLTGLVGVGGGFVVVPILTLVVGLPPRRAVGTSLAVVAASSLAGLVGASGGAPSLTPTLLWFLVGAGLAALAGARLADRLPQARLRSILGLALVVVASVLLGQLLVPPLVVALRAGGPG